MSDLKEYSKLKDKVDAAQQKASKAEGALGQVKKQLKSDFGCSSLPEANKKLKQLKKQEQKIDSEYDEAVENFKETWETLG